MGPTESSDSSDHDCGDDPRLLSSPSLVSGLRRGDPDAWERFFALWGKTLLDYCLHRGFQLQDAEEITQNVLAKVHRGIGRFKRDGGKLRLRHWVFDIARKESIRFRERYQNKPASPGGSDFQVVSNQVPAPSFGEETTGSIEFERVLMSNILQKIEGDFEPHVWKAFWLSVVEGLTGPEISTQLGMQPNAVRQAVFRVKKRIQEKRDEFPQKDPT